MGDIKRVRRKYKPPRIPWDKIRLVQEQELLGKYGLRNKREIWRARAVLRRYRVIARKLIGMPPNEKNRALEKKILEKLKREKVLSENAKLEAVLNLTVEDFLRRRLQTIVFEKGLAKTIYEARQLITHGHVAVAGRRIKKPSYIVKREEEDTITFTQKGSGRKVS